MSDKQRTLINPTQKDALFGFIAYDAKGKGEVQKIAKRRLYVIEGNINSYSKFINDPKILKSINNFKHICSSAAEVSEEVEQWKVHRKERNETEAAEKAQRKADLDAKEAANKAELPPLHTAYAFNYKDRADQITCAALVTEINKEYKVPFLKELMYYFYGGEKCVPNSMKKPELIELFADNVTYFPEGNNTSG